VYSLFRCEFNGKEDTMLHPNQLPLASTDTENLGIVDSLLHPMAVLIRQLLNRSEREQLGLFLIDDEENIRQAVAGKISICAVFYAGEEGLSDRLQAYLPPDTPIYEVAKRTCKKLFENDKLTRVFAIAEMPPPLELEALAELPQDIVVLEEVAIAGNVGAMIRTSLALGIGGMVLLNSDPMDVYDRRLIRASRGYLFALPIVTATTDELLRFCRHHCIGVLATSPFAECSLNDIAVLPQRLAIVFGNEKQGCSQTLLEAATIRVKIPTMRVESLNVSVAAGITLYSRLRFNQVA
jgi:tRNA G18 (ribose-2'-O)-methylase SpoU